jgi:hypothetical protein
VTFLWRIAPGASPELRHWQIGYVVHHALSNDTLHLSDTAGLILTELLAAGTKGLQDPGKTLALPEAELQATLNALADLGFISQC